MSKRKPLTKILLAVLHHMQEVGAELDTQLAELGPYVSAYAKAGGGYVAELRKLRTKAEAASALRSLQKSRYLEARKVGKRFELFITEKGKQALLVDKLKHSPLNANKYSTVVIFDIPESQRRLRRELRLLLRQANFLKLQHSVWASKADTYAVVVDFIKQMKLGRWVNVFHACDFLFFRER